ncbi:MAG: beta-ketoacyl synthase chain length factor [Candidatus Polarisedimenticolaceae bacterium]|nr:beta-ketoacyl synthase chain length factor [Candidatus Polarisedimenticolaceae bacterium]
MKPVYIEAIGLIGPGLASWQQAAAILADDGEYQTCELPTLKPGMLKPNERRRTTLTIKLALQAVQDALASNRYPDLSTVFASSDGDMDIVDRICQALCLPDRPVSPTFFHNSVHNAPAGYCSIATGFHAPSTSLSGLNGSFAVGLLDAAVQATVEQQPVMLVSYDTPWPGALNRFRAQRSPFGVALVLSPQESAQSVVELTLLPGTGGDESKMVDSGLEQLRVHTPAASSLPLLEAIAQNSTARLVLPYLVDEQIAVEVRPCR